MRSTRTDSMARRWLAGLARLSAVAAVAATVGTLAGLAGGPAVSVAHAQAGGTAQTIADHFSKVQTMAGEFVQFGPRGEQTGGKFYIQRPGKVRFNYDGKAGYKVVADGKSVVIENDKMTPADL